MRLMTSLMMRLTLSLSLFLLANAACAETWVKYTQTGEAHRYFDKDRTMSMGGTAFIWDLHDLKTPAQSADGRDYRSVLHAVEVNCRKEQRRVLSRHRLSGAMGAGAVVDEISMVSEWSEPAAETPEARLMSIACEMK